jgi:hypothetical protein
MPMHPLSVKYVSLMTHRQSHIPSRQSLGFFVEPWCHGVICQEVKVH